MNHYLFRTCRLLSAMLVTVLLLVGVAPSLACGGLFCQNSPVDQNAERIIFTQNHDGTISAIIQIQYTGFAEDFSWILPLPSVISAEDIEVPETAMNAFTELEIATSPIFIPPRIPEDCILPLFQAMSEDAVAVPGAVGVEIFASGEVGPYAFDVIGSHDPTALIRWLRDNDYLVTEPMEPLIELYVVEGFAFLAMSLLPDQGVQEIQPIKVTYESDRPMIPLRLTAVAANPDMAVLTWFYADQQAVPANFAHMEISDSELVFDLFGTNNYRSLLGTRADEFGGQAFITEYAAPTRELAVSDPLLLELQSRFNYLTRLNTVISPEEMTLDPTFDYDAQRRDVSNIHDLSDTEFWYPECQSREEIINQTEIEVPTEVPPAPSSLPAPSAVPTMRTPQPNVVLVESASESTFVTGIILGGTVVVIVFGLIVVGIAIGRSRRS